MTAAQRTSYDTHVVTDIPKFVEVAGHHAPAPFWVAPGMFPGVKLRLAGMDASKIVGAPHAAPHVHDKPEIYVAPDEGKGALVVEIRMDHETFLLESPFAVFIPPGVSHCFKVITCDGPNWVLGILLEDWKRPD